MLRDSTRAMDATVTIEDRVSGSRPSKNCLSLGHQITLVPRYSLVMGKGNAVERDNKLQVNFGASDPRTDGQATPEMMPF